MEEQQGIDQTPIRQEGNHSHNLMPLLASAKEIVSHVASRTRISLKQVLKPEPSTWVKWSVKLIVAHYDTHLSLAHIAGRLRPILYTGSLSNEVIPPLTTNPQLPQLLDMIANCMSLTLVATPCDSAFAASSSGALTMRKRP